MKQIFYLLFIYSSLIYGQCSIDKGYYKVIYDQDLQSPTYAEYVVLCPTKGPASRKGMNFHAEPGVETADNDDFYKNVWDKGHLAPAAAFDCNYEILNTTFSYVNAALQHESLNRGLWKKLEAYERELALSQTVTVLIILEFDDPPRRVPAGAAIPSKFFKVLQTPSKEYCYSFPNTALTDKNLNNYKTKCISANAPKKWYEDGTLHEHTLKEWVNASERNKEATAADIAAELWKKEIVSKGKLWESSLYAYTQRPKTQNFSMSK